MAADQLAVLLMAYGGPGNLAEVEPYLLDVRGGRPTKPQLVEEIRARYARIGGRSPILEHTRAQAAGVGRALGTGFRTYVGMRHWHPYIKDSVAEIRRAGTQRVVGVVMAPHYSGMSVGAYEKKLLEAAHESEPLEVALVRSWWEQPAFLDTMANRVRQALQRFPKPSEVQVIFTAHSLPERILAAGDPYPEELKASAAEVARRLELGEWHFAYQSAGATNEPWLGPDAAELMTKLAREKRADAMLLVPIGFVCDHVEILYDIDIEYQALARRLGVQLERTASLNDDPGLVAAVAQVVKHAAAERDWL
ncbi:MAG: ferrochelatase [Gemmatimonadetes bacterium]|nr:MAG: ferrochelatase [Gemmatimonadetes bacterium 13_1_40CM_3_66_12]OLD86569.1 MAG: ferrochelatase [Gemmatimonadetes bacterium 13_1_20CM_4_66_11]PYP95224.1 MAG: ferrochelatase [Gemmatimonadota bacterium]